MASVSLHLPAKHQVGVGRYTIHGAYGKRSYILNMQKPWKAAIFFTSLTTFQSRKSRVVHYDHTQISANIQLEFKMAILVESFRHHSFRFTYWLGHAQTLRQSEIIIIILLCWPFIHLHEFHLCFSVRMCRTQLILVLIFSSLILINVLTIPKDPDMS